MEVKDAGAAVFAIGSEIVMRNITMSNVQANQGASLSLSYGSDLLVHDSAFSNLTAFTNGGISLLDASAEIYDSSFFNCTAVSSGSGIYADYSGVLMNNTIFNDMLANNGATVFALNDAELNITHSVFRNCTTTIGVINL